MVGVNASDLQMDLPVSWLGLSVEDRLAPFFVY